MERIVGFVERLLWGRWGISRMKTKLQGLFESFSEGVQVLRKNPKGLVPPIVLSIMPWIFESLAIFLVFLAIEVDIHFFKVMILTMKYAPTPTKKMPLMISRITRYPSGNKQRENSKPKSRTKATDIEVRCVKTGGMEYDLTGFLNRSLATEYVRITMKNIIKMLGSSSFEL